MSLGWAGNSSVTGVTGRTVLTHSSRKGPLPLQSTARMAPGLAQCMLSVIHAHFKLTAVIRPVKQTAPANPLGPLRHRKLDQGVRYICMAWESHGCCTEQRPLCQFVHQLNRRIVVSEHHVRQHIGARQAKTQMHCKAPNHDHARLAFYISSLQAVRPLYLRLRHSQLISSKTG